MLDPIRPPKHIPVEAGAQAAPAADVIIDFVLEDGALLLSVANVGRAAAHKVRVAFEPAFRGVGGSVLVPELALFRRLEFLAPGREIRAFIDSTSQYFARGEPEVIQVSVTHSDDAGRTYRRRLTHDLGIYRDLPSRGPR